MRKFCVLNGLVHMAHRIFVNSMIRGYYEYNCSVNVSWEIAMIHTSLAFADPFTRSQLFGSLQQAQPNNFERVKGLAIIY